MGLLDFLMGAANRGGKGRQGDAHRGIAAKPAKKGGGGRGR